MSAAKKKLSLIVAMIALSNEHFMVLQIETLLITLHMHRTKMIL